MIQKPLTQKQLIKILKALANPKRVQIIFHLRKHRLLNVSGLAEKLDLSFRSTSKHLLKMDDAGLIDRRKERNEVYYTLSEDMPQEVIGLFARIGE